MNLQGSSSQRYREWMDEWGDLRLLDMEILKAIETDHCKTYCGLIPASVKDSHECAAHREELYLKYLEEINRLDLAEIIRSEFRWGKDKL